MEKDIDPISLQEAQMISDLYEELGNYIPKNEVRRDIYEGKNKLKSLDIAVPKLMAGINLVIGWGRTVVDAIVKRTLLEKIADKNGSWLETIFNDNQGRLLAQKIQKDACTYGTGYALIGAGDPTQLEPEILLTAESPFRSVAATGRSGEVTAFLIVKYDKKGYPKRGSLYLTGQVITFSFPVHGKTYQMGISDQYVPYVLINRYATNLPFVPAEKLPNNPAGSDNSGTSELTPSIISSIDGAMRTLAQGEYAREIYSHPQRIILDVDSKTAQEIFEHGLSASVDDAWVFTRTEEEGAAIDGKKYAPAPQVQQLAPSEPTPFISWLKAYAQFIAGETGIPVSRLGWSNNGNPTSAEALKAEEVELVRNANMRKDVFDAFWYRLSVKLFYIKFGRFPNPGEFEYVSHWVKPDVQTPAADVDAALKLSQINPAMPGADVFFSRAGLDADEVKRIMNQANAEGVLEGNLATLAQAARENNPILEKLKLMNAENEESE